MRNHKMKKFLQRYMPDPNMLKAHKHIRLFGERLHDTNLWHLNRYSVAWAFSIGLFTAFLPIPFQMIVAAAFAIIIRANIPISIVLVWITNPITMPPIFYFNYKVGTWILDIPTRKFTIDLSYDWLTSHLGHIWQPLWLGSILVGLILAISAQIVIRILWRIIVSKAWTKRKLR